ncbi:MAG: DNA polymerase III subunit delta [Omnitrophica bacterium]|nr:DNA polymerase III subunit delta [Candidatus Omnitrophota bacterium]
MNYLVIGPEEYLKRQFLEETKKAIFGAAFSGLDFDAFYAGTKEMALILDSLNTLPFSSKARLVVIWDVEKFRTPEKDSILKYLKSPRGSTTLVMVSSSSGFNKFLSEISGFTETIRCYRLTQQELKSWVRKEFAARNKKISPDLAELILENTDEDLYTIKNEIEKISSFTGSSSEISERDIKSTQGTARVESAFELVDFVIEKKRDKIFLAAGDLLIKEKPHRILSLLAWQFRNFMKIKNFPRGLPVDEIARRLKLNRFFTRKALDRSKRFSRDDLVRKMEVILEGDLYIKRGTMLPEHALDRVLVGLCR